jgi:hypothetical protein
LYCMYNDNILIKHNGSKNNWHPDS